MAVSCFGAEGLAGFDIRRWAVFVAIDGLIPESAQKFDPSNPSRQAAKPRKWYSEIRSSLAVQLRRFSYQTV